MPDAPLTPMMQQYWDAKTAHPGAMVMFRNGDFYELFEDDAVVGSRILGIRLTKRDEKVPMAGVPVEKLDHYLGVLIRAGQRVAVCEQMEEPGPGKKLIRREVNRVVTAGTITEDELLDPRRANHLAAVVRNKAGAVGLAWVDPSTGTFSACDVDPVRLADELARVVTAECLLPESDADGIAALFAAQPPRSTTPRPDWTFDPTTATAALRQHFAVSTFTGFGFDDGQPCLLAAGAILQYLQETLKAGLGHVRRLTRYRAESHLVLDEVTRRSLELTRTLRDNSREGSLLSVMDRTVTPMGARFLHDALLAPFNSVTAIDARLDAVEELLKEHQLRGDLRELLETASDLQRLTTRASTGRATPRDLGAIARTLRLLPKFKAKLTARRSALLAELDAKLELCPDLRELLDASLRDELPQSAKDGGLIREGYHAELDHLRTLAKSGKDWILQYQAAEITRTAINSLKVGYNQIDGYYLEITNANETRVPENYKHQKTLKGAKRYYTSELREYEEKILSADDKAKALELELFTQIRNHVAAQTHRLLTTAETLATVDALQSLAEVAASRNFVRPNIVAEPVLDIREGRHPVLDQTLPPGTFVPNDARFGDADGLFWLITGPNMAGKSTFIRQVALVTLLAQVGSFVPAAAATIGLTDRVFTRVGASDELSRGQSTFMVEMTEAANILNNATPHSLVILDEIGRGTSTYDGVSLAWAITEHLHSAVGCRTLFATHYHELAILSETLPNLRNYNVQVQELAKEVIFLHKIAPGNADKSYGIHVARLAGVPEDVLARAEEVLAALEAKPVPTTTKLVRTKRAVKPPVEVIPPESPKRRVKQAGPSLFDEG
jgi:DNA mismatch repair protein MutS